MSATHNANSAAVTLADIAREAYIYAGAGAAVLRQMMHPGVGAGVAEHSATLTQPLSRLRSTMDYIYVVVLGNDAERARIAEKVNRAHVPVHSENYNAFDPQLQLWVAATLYKGSVELFELFNGPLDEESHTRIYQQAAIYGTTLQVEADMWPADRAAFSAYWEQSIASFTVAEPVRQYVQQLLNGGAAPWYVKILMPLQKFVTRALLEPQIREQFGLSWSARDEKRWQLMLRMVRWIYSITPVTIRHLVHHTSGLRDEGCTFVASTTVSRPAARRLPAM